LCVGFGFWVQGCKRVGVHGLYNALLRVATTCGWLDNRVGWLGTHVGCHWCPRAICILVILRIARNSPFFLWKVFFQLSGTCWLFRDLVHPNRQGNSIAIAARKKFPAAVHAAREHERPLLIPKVLEIYEGKENQKKWSSTMADEAGSHFVIRVWSAQQGLASRNSKYQRFVGPLAVRPYDH
jgi:hypothetical protein